MTRAVAEPRWRAKPRLAVRKEVWGPDSVEENQYLRVYMGQLRRKIETDPAKPRYLRTEAGVGYRLADE